MNAARDAAREDVTSKIRRQIIASYWLVVLLALPLWWYTTSIERLSLPERRVRDEVQRQLRFPVRVELDTNGQGVNSRELAREISSNISGQWTELDVAVTAETESTVSASYRISVQPGIESPRLQERTLVVPSPHPASISTILSELLDPYARISSEAHALRVVKYAPRYRLAFSLLNEDAAAGGAALAWDVQSAINRHIRPVLERVSVLHNFTIESQVQFHAPLAVKPNPAGDGFGLSTEDLTVFINSAEWMLSSSVSDDPVIHFVLFVPSASRRPLHILDDNGAISPSTAFILPQWGGVVLFNPSSADANTSFELTPSLLDAPFTQFRAQLLSLLGVAPLPAGVRSSAAISAWQLDALLRRRALENVRGSRETLTSIVQLVHQLDQMPVGPDVRGDVQDALNALDKVYASPAAPATALAHSADALTLSSRAFFNPGMLALLYFPAEHKYAVYMPLFAPVTAPLVSAVVKEVRRWRKERKERREAQERARQAAVAAEDVPQ